MHRIAKLVVAVAVFANAAHADSGPPWDLARLAWMAGTWTGTQDGIETEEVWMAPRGGALLGLHRDVKDGRMVSFEFFRIAAAAEGTFYFASPRAAVPVPFRLVEMDAHRVVFENKEHDFPQRVLYWLDDAGSLHARIEGNLNGKAAGEEWTWTRAR